MAFAAPLGKRLNLEQSLPQSNVRRHTQAREHGITRIGHDGDGFCFDNETPAHDALLHPHMIGNRLITNAEYRDFIDDGAYSRSEL